MDHRLRNGLHYEINAFQNYSDNDYSIYNWVRTFTVNADGSVTKHPVDKTDEKKVKRFNDTFHNEALIGKIENNEQKNANWNATVHLSYRFGGVHSVTFNHVDSGFKRTTRNYIGTKAGDGCCTTAMCHWASMSPSFCY